MCFYRSLTHSLIHTSNISPLNGELFLRRLCDSVEMQMFRSYPDLMEPFILSACPPPSETSATPHTHTHFTHPELSLTDARQMHHDAVTRTATLQCQPDTQLSHRIKNTLFVLKHLHKHTLGLLTLSCWKPTTTKPLTL